MKELISKLAGLCYEVTEKTEYQASFDFAGYVEGVQVRIEKPNHKKVFDSNLIFLDFKDQTDHLLKIESVLEGVLNGTVTFKPTSTKVIPEQTIETYEVLGVNDIG